CALERVLDAIGVEEADDENREDREDEEDLPRSTATLGLGARRGPTVRVPRQQAQAIAHVSPLGTGSPGAVPRWRSASSAVCRITVAATWSTTLRDDLLERPLDRNCACAVIVDIRSSKSRICADS